MARLLQAEMDRLEQLQTNNAQAIIQEERETSPDNLVESALHTIAGVAQGALAAWTSIVHAPSRRPPPSLSSIRQLPVYPYDTKKCGTDTLDLECLVCQHEYKDGDGMKRLPCFHAFHAACIDPWLAKRGVRISSIIPLLILSIDVSNMSSNFITIAFCIFKILFLLITTLGEKKLQNVAKIWETNSL